MSVRQAPVTYKRTKGGARMRVATAHIAAEAMAHAQPHLDADGAEGVETLQHPKRLSAAILEAGWMRI